RSSAWTETSGNHTIAILLALLSFTSLRKRRSTRSHCQADRCSSTLERSPPRPTKRNSLALWRTKCPISTCNTPRNRPARRRPQVCLQELRKRLSAQQWEEKREEW